MGSWSLCPSPWLLASGCDPVLSLALSLLKPWGQPVWAVLDATGGWTPQCLLVYSPFPSPPALGLLLHSFSSSLFCLFALLCPGRVAACRPAAEVYLAGHLPEDPVNSDLMGTACPGAGHRCWQRCWAPTASTLPSAPAPTSRGVVA